MKTTHPQLRPKEGFALVISLALMSFVLLLMLSFITLTSVETRVASQSKQRLRAEQNALLALHVALGELQKTSGPDQRVTARADLQNPETATNPYWTGVYGHSLTPRYDLRPEQIATELTDTSKVDAQGSPAKLINWLVSGNFTSDAWPTFADTGEITDLPASSNIPFLPNAAVANVEDATPADSNAVTIQDTAGNARPARILVGSGSVASADDFVVAPVVEMNGAGALKTDAFAWWVGDENVKARANLEMETDPDRLTHAFVNTTRTAIELMAAGDSDGALDEPRIGTGYDPTSPVDRAYFLNDLTLVSSLPETLSPILKGRYHDVTMSSESLLVDTFAGGLKQDLTALLDAGYFPGSIETTANDKRLWTLHANDSSGYAVPTWKHLRSFAQTTIPSSRSVPVRLPAYDRSDRADDVGVYPVITYFSLGFGASLSAPPAEGVDANLNLYPLVVLWNPYDFTLKAPPQYPGGGNFEVGMFPSNEAIISVQIKDSGEHNGKPYSWRSLGFFNFLKVEGAAGGESFIRFRLDCPDIPPGESFIFCILPEDSGKNYTPDFVLKHSEPERESFVKIPIATLEADDLPEPVPEPELDPGESRRFRLGPYLYTESGASLADPISFGGGGQMHVYLGEPVKDPVLMDLNSAETHDPAAPNRSWYQTHQDVDWTNSIVETMAPTATLNTSSSGNKFVADETLGGDRDAYSLLQAPKDLAFESMPLPTFTYVFQALFSGKGSNAKVDPAQHMFTTRWIAQGNMRAPRTGRTRRDKNYNPLFIATAGSTLLKTPWMKFQSGEGALSNRTSAGSGHDWVGEQPEAATLFTFPYEEVPLFSIGQLQHANLSFVGAYPSYPIGNSLADFRINEKSGAGVPNSPIGYQLVRAEPFGGGSVKSLKADQLAYYDISFLLNRNLWDRYFFSTIPQTGAMPDDLPNPRMRKTVDDAASLRDADSVARHLAVLGGFNINSTSEQAWRAVLGGNIQLEYDPQNPPAATATPLNVSYPRFTKPTSGDDPNEAWEGYRTLTPEQVAQLARNIVEEIKNRGPFVSLGGFVNRRLVDNPATAGTDLPSEYENFRGALQAALDRTFVSSADEFPVNDGADTFWADDELTDDTQSTQFTHSSQAGPYDQKRFWGADLMRRPYSNRSAFSPKYVTQADVLSTIGASLSARSDTFTIRAYGEAVTGSGDDGVAVWCEAVVQRLPDYVDPVSDSAEVVPSDPVNKSFGRKYKIISFRWLTKEEV